MAKVKTEEEKHVNQYSPASHVCEAEGSAGEQGRLYTAQRHSMSHSQPSEKVAARNCLQSNFGQHRGGLTVPSLCVQYFLQPISLSTSEQNVKETSLLPFPCTNKTKRQENPKNYKSEL